MPSTSPSTDSVVKAPRRRFVADEDEKVGPSSRHLTNGVVTLDTPEDEAPIRYFVFRILCFQFHSFLFMLI